MLKRLIDSLVVLFGVSTLVFLLAAIIPGDPVDVMLGERASAADRAQLVAAMGLDQPLWQRWSHYMLSLLQGDLGQSLLRQQAVTDLILERLPATLQLSVAAFAIIVLIALPLGLAAAHEQGRWPDQVARVFALLGQSIPNFWLGPLLVLLFAIALNWLPVSGRGASGSWILPAVTLGLSMAALSMRMLRSSLLEVLHQDYVRTARAKGLSGLQAVWRHALPNALLPVVTLLSLQLGGLLAGAVITEVVFAWPGVGSLLIEAINQRDYPLIQGVVLMIACSYVLINALTDALIAWLDPRVSSGVASGSRQL